MKDQSLIFTTQSGGVGVCKLISKEDYKVLRGLQMLLSERLQMLVPLSHDEIRFNYSAVDDVEYSPLPFSETNLIDGDFIMRFFTLARDIKDQIEKEMNMNVTEFIQNFQRGLLFS